jgi:hypothetical protein
MYKTRYIPASLRYSNNNNNTMHIPRQEEVLQDSYSSQVEYHPSSFAQEL